MSVIKFGWKWIHLDHFILNLVDSGEWVQTELVFKLLSLCFPFYHLKGKVSLGLYRILLSKAMMWLGAWALPLCYLLGSPEAEKGTLLAMDCSSTNDPLPIACPSLPQGHQVKNAKAGPMDLVTAWVRIEESDIDPVIPSPSSDTKGKHRLNSLNTRDDYNSNY